MNNDIQGKDNRAAGRDFHEGNIQVDQLIGRDVLNISIPGNKETESAPLVPAQRKQLNQMVKDVAEASNEEGFVVWQRVHAEVGVNSVNEMTKEQYPAALEHLQKELDKLNDTSACKALMHQLLKKTSNEDQRQCLYQYCDISFGSRRLAGLSKAQLQQALGWLCNEQNEEEKILSSPQLRMTWQELLRAYPLVIGITFICGTLLGTVLF